LRAAAAAFIVSTSITDPFAKSIKATIGTAAQTIARITFYSVVYWYQAEPACPLSYASNVEQRLPALQSTGGPAVQAHPRTMHGRSVLQCLPIREASPKQRLPVPIAFEEPESTP